CPEARGASRRECCCWGRNLLSGGVLAARLSSPKSGVEGSSSDFGSVLNHWNSSTTGQGPSAAASTPSLRMPPVGGLGSRNIRQGLRRWQLRENLGRKTRFRGISLKSRIVCERIRLFGVPLRQAQGRPQNRRLGFGTTSSSHL